MSSELLATKKFLIVAGMHRSNTSYFTHCLSKAGLNLGNDLIAASKSNKHGHFEDEDIVDFHKALISQNNLESRWNYVQFSKIEAFTPSDQDIQKATSILTHKIQDNTHFAWKDPRNCHFLSLWLKVVPQAKFVLIVRRPEECVRSLMRRSLQNNKWKLRPDLYFRFHKYWEITNKQILNFYNANKESSLILLTPDHISNSTFHRYLNNTIFNIWKFPKLHEIDLMENYDKSLITSNSHVFYKQPRTTLLYDKLATLANQQLV